MRWVGGIFLAACALLAGLGGPAKAAQDWNGERPGWDGHWTEESLPDRVNERRHYEGTVDGCGSVRLQNERGEHLRGQLYPNGWVTLRDSQGYLYRGSLEPTGRLKARDAHGDEITGRASLP